MFTYYSAKKKLGKTVLTDNGEVGIIYNVEKLWKGEVIVWIKFPSGKKLLLTEDEYNKRITEIREKP